MNLCYICNTCNACMPLFYMCDSVVYKCEWSRWGYECRGISENILIKEYVLQKMYVKFIHQIHFVDNNLYISVVILLI